MSSYWIIVCPLGGREEATKEFLKKFDVECYVPMGRRTVRTRRAPAVEVRYVAFPGYAFVKIDAENPCWGTIEMCPFILSTIVVERRGAVMAYRLDDADMAAIRANEYAGFYDERREAKPTFKPGTFVHITSGLMQGLGGKVVRQAGSGRLMIEVQGCSVKLPLDFLRPVVL